MVSKITHNHMRLSHAIMYMTGYITPSQRRMYWEKREDTMNTLVKKAMSQKTFISFITNTYFVDKITPDPEDRYARLKTLIFFS